MTTNGRIRGLLVGSQNVEINRLKQDKLIKI